MSTTIQDHSRLRFGELRVGDNVTFWDTLDLPVPTPQSGDLRYQVTATDRIDTLAYKFYGDSTLWWVLALANDLELLPTALYPGQMLKIPAPTYILNSYWQEKFRES